MSSLSPGQIGAMTDVVTASTSSQAKALTVSNSQFLLIENADTTNGIFVNSGNSAITITFPTTSVGQNGSYIGPGKTLCYRKNNPSDTHLAYICSAGTPTAYIQESEGI